MILTLREWLDTLTIDPEDNLADALVWKDRPFTDTEITAIGGNPYVRLAYPAGTNVRDALHSGAAQGDYLTDLYIYQQPNAYGQAPSLTDGEPQLAIRLWHYLRQAHKPVDEAGYGEVLLQHGAIVVAQKPRFDPGAREVFGMVRHRWTVGLS